MSLHRDNEPFKKIGVIMRMICLHFSAIKMKTFSTRLLFKIYLNKIIHNRHNTKNDTPPFLKKGLVQCLEF